MEKTWTGSSTPLKFWLLALHSVLQVCVIKYWPWVSEQQALPGTSEEVPQLPCRARDWHSAGDWHSSWDGATHLGDHDHTLQSPYSAAVTIRRIPMHVSGCWGQKLTKIPDNGAECQCWPQCLLLLM